MDKRFVQLKHMVRNERDNQAFYEGSKIIINLDHVISLKPHASLAGYYTMQMTNDITYVVDHSILTHFPLMGEEYLDKNVF